MVDSAASPAPLTAAQPPRLDKRWVARSFSRAASTYDAAAPLQRDVAELLAQHAQRLKPMVFQGLDLGCGTGALTRQWLQSGWWGRGIGLDLAEGMIRYSRDYYPHDGLSWGVADAEALPLADASVDCVFSSFALQWSENFTAAFRQAQRVLTPRGIFACSLPVAGTLFELNQAWRAVDGYTHVNEFPQPQRLQQALDQAGLRQVAVMQEQRVLTYPDVKTLFRELKAIGAHNVTSGRPKALLGKRHFQQLYRAYDQYRLENGSLPATYEVMYLLAMKE